MKPNDLISLIKDKHKRRTEKIRHLKLEHQPIISEITVAEKEEIHARIDSCESIEERDRIVMEVVIRSLCGWDEVGEITDENIEDFKQVYSSDIVIELYRCIVDFSYLDEKGINAAKKS